MTAVVKDIVSGQRGKGVPICAVVACSKCAKTLCAAAPQVADGLADEDHLFIFRKVLQVLCDPPREDWFCDIPQPFRV